MNNSSWLKTLAIGFSIISFGITIAIVGYFVLTTKQDKTPYQRPISISPAITQNAAGNWKTYTNDEAGYLVKHPTSLDEGAGSSNNPIVDILEDKNNTYAIYIYTYTDSAGFADRSFLEFNAKVKDEEEIIVGGQATKKLTGIEIDFERGTLIHVGPIKYLGKAYLIVYTSGNNIAELESLRVFDQILSTFRFTQ